MPAATAVRDEGPWTKEVCAVRRRLSSMEALLEQIADQIVLPALGSHYFSAGIKRHANEMLYRGIAVRGAQGNRVEMQGGGIGGSAGRLRVSVDYATIPYARFVLEGRGPVVARRRKALRFEIDGEEVYRTRVKASPPHDVYYLTESEMTRVRQLVAAYASLTGTGGLTARVV